MSDRRPLSQGITNNPVVDKEVARAFVHGDKPKQSGPTKTVTTQVHRASITTRIRSDFVMALRRASLERQLEGVEPNTVQDMLEEAIEPWLRAHGYLE